MRGGWFFGLLHLERENDASRVLLRATAGVSGDRRRTAARYSLDIRAFTQHRLLRESHVERVLTAASSPPSAYLLSKLTEISDWLPPYSIDVPPRFGAEQQAHRDRDRRRRGRRMPVRRCWRRMPRRERGSVGLLSFRGAPVWLMERRLLKKPVCQVWIMWVVGRNCHLVERNLNFGGRGGFVEVGWWFVAGFFSGE